MSGIDIEALLQELSPNAPCGEDLEYDAAFGQMERSAQGKPDQQFGDTIIPAEDPDWADVKQQALELLTRTKDLRVVAYLLRALLVVNGLKDFCHGLGLFRGLIERYWDSVHPQLDPEDDNDPTLRVNVLATLCSTGATLNALNTASLVSSRVLGNYSLRDIDIANGTLPAPEDLEGGPPPMSTIDAAFMDCDIDELRETASAIQASISDVSAIETAVTDRVGAANATSFEELIDVLERMAKTLSDQLVRRGVDDDSTEEEGSEPLSESDGEAEPVQHEPQARTGEIMCREDVIRAIDKICDYYQRQEPSSPVPLLLRRAKRLATKTFMDIIRDLTPEGLSQAEAIGGTDDGGDDDEDTSGSEY